MREITREEMKRTQDETRAGKAPGMDGVTAKMLKEGVAMERLLRPSRFDVDPDSAQAAKEWTHWLRTFTNFVEAVQLTTPTLDKLVLLTNFVAPSVYDYISECETYENAEEVLTSLYVKPNNEIFARHLLATRRQNSGESLDQFLQALKLLAKDCQFKSVTAEEACDSYVRDAFINGLVSGAIRQRLLENLTLSLNTAYEQARTLEMAQKHSASYSSAEPVNAAVSAINREEESFSAENNSVSVSAATSSARCFFCGNNRHPRTQCPAKDAVCLKCKKQGHYAKVCRSVKQASGSSNPKYSSAMLASIVGASPKCLEKSITPLKLNGSPVSALIDTGSSDSFVRHNLVDLNKLTMSPEHGKVSMADESLSSNILGLCSVDLELKGETYHGVELKVLQRLCSDVILGHDFLRRHSGLEMDFGGEKPPLKICSLGVVKVAIREEERPYTAFEAGGKLYEFNRIPFGVKNGVAAFQRVLDEILKKEKVGGTFAYVDNVTVCGETEEEHDQNLRGFLKVAEEYNLTLNHSKCDFKVRTIKLLGHAIAATLTQNNRPVAFFSRTLTRSEQGHSAVEKEAYAIVEALRKWRHYLIGHHFKLITDQRSVKFMFDSKSNSKIKNDKIARWRVELSCFHYDIVYRPGTENIPADALSRICGATTSDKLRELHEILCHPGISRMMHFVRGRNLPYSIEEVKKITTSCQVCLELKPRFFKYSGQLIKATQPFERLNLDFKGPVPSQSRNKYFLTVVDEFSRFPFVFPCADMTTRTVISCLVQLFALFGMPAYIHTDRGASFMSEELKDFLMKKGVATSRTTPYNPRGNGQAEKYNGIIWKTLTLALKTRNLDVSQWETVLPDALHSIRSLLCTSTNSTPHERLFLHSRRSTTGQSLPTWLIQGGRALLRRHVRHSKNDPLVDEVEIVETNPEYAHVKLSDGRATTVSLRHLAPMASDYRENSDAGDPAPQSEVLEELSVANAPQEIARGFSHVDTAPQNDTLHESRTVPQQVASPPPLRRSERVRQPPKYLQDYST
ncbi:uncharacterized protein [Palaemon carinicauda]|uniref:uncharacterized protein n=1 Tax=Palaemon carinicauda TaxID=392227 RepID=UPI0035B6992C